MKLYDVHVNVYAGYKADERPRDFTFKEKEHSVNDHQHTDCVTMSF